MNWRQGARTALTFAFATPALVCIACYAVCAVVFSWLDDKLTEEP